MRARPGAAYEQKVAESANTAVEQSGDWAVDRRRAVFASSHSVSQGARGRVVTT